MCYSKEGEKVPLELYKITKDFSLERMSDRKVIRRKVKGADDEDGKRGRKGPHGFILRGPGKVKKRLRCSNAKIEAKWATALEQTIKQEV